MKRLTRGEAIRAFCLACAETQTEVRECDVTDCDLWRYRMHREDRKATNARVTRSKAVRLKCVDCMGGQRSLIPGCTSVSCALWPYRNGVEIDSTRPVSRSRKRGGP